MINMFSQLGVALLGSLCRSQRPFPPFPDACSTSDRSDGHQVHNGIHNHRDCSHHNHIHSSTAAWSNFVYPTPAAQSESLLWEPGIGLKRKISSPTI